MDCACDRKELRVRTYGNGTCHYVYQCPTCGAHSQNVKKETLGIDARLAAKPFDENLRGHWWAEQSETRKAQQSAEYAVKLAARHEVMDEYYDSERWKAKRRLVFQRDEYRCRAGLGGCEGRARECHHLSYQHFGNEPLFELISVCKTCHDQITDMDRTSNEEPA